MTSRERSHSMLESPLAGLDVHDAGPERVERIRSLCLLALARKRKAGARRGVVALWRDRLEVAVAAGLSALYLAGVVERTLEILR